MVTTISSESIHYQRFLNQGITAFSQVAQITPTAESKARYEEMVASGMIPSSVLSGETKGQGGLPITNLQPIMNDLPTSRLPWFMTHTTEHGLTGKASESYLNTTDGQLQAQRGRSGLASGPIETTTVSGLDVKVEHSWVHPEGEKPTDLNKQSGYTVTLSRNGEVLETYSGAGDVRITEREDGTFEIVPLAEGETILNGTESDDIILSWNAAEVHAGGGNDTVLPHGSGSYFMGDGNDTVLITQHFSSAAQVDLGEGDNTVSANWLSRASIVGGNGNNKIFAGTTSDSNATLGDGQNIVVTKGMANSHIKAGHGGNIIYVGYLSSNKDLSSIITGNGDDLVRPGIVSGAGNINLGGGQNESLEWKQGGGLDWNVWKSRMDSFEDMIAGILVNQKNLPGPVKDHFFA